MKSVGVTLGTVEMKELTSTIKANGLLSVPNSNKATITSLYGGIIKTINIQVGSIVKKGQVIATIANPEYIQLQEDYLTTNSRITYAEQEFRRQRELFDNDAGAKKNLQSADAELKTLRTKRASLLKQLQMMGIIPEMSITEI
jgi:multidrug efflux pump subunit AcrA (membrane-fusion protein)